MPRICAQKCHCQENLGMQGLKPSTHTRFHTIHNVLHNGCRHHFTQTSHTELNFLSLTATELELFLLPVHSDHILYPNGRILLQGSQTEGKLPPSVAGTMHFLHINVTVFFFLGT
jgi:hypothetical protein